MVIKIQTSQNIGKNSDGGCSSWKKRQEIDKYEGRHRTLKTLQTYNNMRQENCFKKLRIYPTGHDEVDILLGCATWWWCIDISVSLKNSLPERYGKWVDNLKNVRL